MVMPAPSSGAVVMRQAAMDANAKTVDTSCDRAEVSYNSLHYNTITQVHSRSLHNTATAQTDNGHTADYHHSLSRPNSVSMATTQTATLSNNVLASKPASLAAPLPQQRTRPYKDFLTPALHRRFVRAALLCLATCYVTSLLISRPSLLWIWNPLSWTGIRVLLLFIACLAIFIVRVANLHCGTYITASPVQSVVETAGSWKGAHTLALYTLSAVFFGEVYIWSHGEAANLGWVDSGKSYERVRLNENPIFMRALFIILAAAQTAIHLGRDDDRIPIPTQDEDPTQQQQAQSRPKPLQDLLDRAPAIGFRTLRLSVPAVAFTLPVYFLLLRKVLWPYFYSIGRTFFAQLPPSSRPTGLTHLPTLTWQCFSSTWMLITLWEVSNAAFTVFVTRTPFNRAGQPLTGDERSKDPNGSLISGLKSRKEVPKTFAFWELSLICAFFDARRKTIYTEVDRQGGSTWTQVSKLCLDEIAAIQERIQGAQQAPPPPPQPSQSQSPSPQQQQQQPLGLPRIADRGVQNGDVWAKPPPDFVQSVGNVAKSLGQSPNAPNPVVPRAKRALEWSADRMLSKEEQARLSTEGLSKEAGGLVTRFLRTPVGEPFRQTFARRVQAVVFGTPYGKGLNIIHASRALSMLGRWSLKEDDYGQVAKSVALIIRTYTEAITAIQGFVQGLKPDWTDVCFTEQERDVKEVREVVGVLKQGLEEVLLAFGEYASAVGLSKKELREARDLFGRGVEMRKV